MPFVKGRSGNIYGRPPKEKTEERDTQPSELDSVIRRLRRASPKALTLLVQGMEDDSVPMKDRMKYAKEIYDLYLKTLGVDANLKKSKTTENTDGGEEDKPVIPAVVFKLHETRKTGTDSK